jgi:4-amino-4-deoxy-L-arabinose transferase-like glycosyltransferase
LPKSFRRIPRPLLLLLPVVLLCTTIWTFVNPLWAAPDEPQHYAYAETLAEQGHRPNRGIAIDQAEFITGQDAFFRTGELSTEAQRVLDAFNAYANVTDLYSRPPWGETAEDRYNAVARVGRRDDGGRANGASSYPPLYYALETIPYRVASSATAANRVYAMRWFSGLWALVTAVGAWLLAGEVFGRRRLPQLACAATLGLWPVITFISAAVNPDAMLIALSTLALWLAVRVARRGAQLWPSLALVGVVALATLSKVSGAALAPAAAFAIITGLPAVRARTHDRVPRLLGLGVGMLVAAALVLLVGDAAGVLPAQLDAITSFRPDLSHFASYLWQFYLPNPGFLDGKTFVFPVISELPVYNTWLGTSWGTFGWVEIWFPKWAYGLFFVLSMAVVAGALTTGWRALRARRAEATPGSAAAAIVLVIAAVAVLAGVHLQDFSNDVSGQLPFAQGRYLFPVAGIGGLAVGGAVLALPDRWRPAATGSWLGFLVVFQFASLCLIAIRFYA